MTEQELEERTTGIIDRLTEEELQWINKACTKLDKAVIFESLMKATRITKGGG